MRIGGPALMVAGAILLLILWEISSDWLEVPKYILPAPIAVWRALWSGLYVPLTSPTGFYVPLASTLYNGGIGFMIGATLGVLLGSLMAESRIVEMLLMPYAFALQTLPKVAIAPLIVIWCGFGDGSKITMAALLTFFPMMVNTFSGIQGTEPERVDLMRSLSASRFETYWRVKLPSAAPFIFAGIDMGIVYALLGTIVAEFLGAQQGIGVTIVQAQAVTDVATVFAALILLAIIGMSFHSAVRRIERRVVHWARRDRG
jgi:NitT/TauT family transport system permease protein